jgi:hypothetical protein
MKGQPTLPHVREHKKSMHWVTYEWLVTKKDSILGRLDSGEHVGCTLRGDNGGTRPYSCHLYGLEHFSLPDRFFSR